MLKTQSQSIVVNICLKCPISSASWYRNACVAENCWPAGISWLSCLPCPLDGIAYFYLRSVICLRIERLREGETHRKTLESVALTICKCLNFCLLSTYIFMPGKRVKSLHLTVLRSYSTSHVLHTRKGGREGGTKLI